MIPMRKFKWLICCLLLLAGVGAGVAADKAKPINLKATLLWGTNDDISKNKDGKPADPELAKKFKKVFKWKNYLEIDSKAVKVEPFKTKDVQMGKGKLKIRHMGLVKDSKGKKDVYRIEVKLFGEGKQVINRKQPISPGETITLAGNDKNDTAWFISITRK